MLMIDMRLIGTRGGDAGVGRAGAGVGQLVPTGRPLGLGPA